LKKWKIKAGKAMFAIQTTIEDEMLEHIRPAKTPKEAWDTFASLFTKKNDTRLQLLENELLSIRQCDMTINQYFTKVKSLCREISALDSGAGMSDARIRRIIIHGLRPEYRTFIAAIQGWPSQPSLVELENLLADQEALAKQTSGVSLKSDEEALFSRDKKGRPRPNTSRNTRKHDDKDSHHGSSQIGGAQNKDKRGGQSKNNNKFDGKCYNFASMATWLKVVGSRRKLQKAMQPHQMQKEQAMKNGTQKHHSQWRKKN
jgi:hypothetical protein